MRLAILSDIHANLEALEAVLADAREQKCAEFVCLGDVAGYNASPGECIKIIQDLKCPVVKGNHDEQVAIATPTEGFNELAEEAIGWTRQQLSPEDKRWLANLSLTKQVRNFTIVHATLDRPEKWGYVFNDLDAAASFTFQRTALCFFGHTHCAGGFVRDDRVHHITTQQILVSAGKKYFINPGSIGQPRDRDWRAAYCILDCDRQTIEQRRVKYDLATAQKKIRQAGLPGRLADRLALGR